MSKYQITRHWFRNRNQKTFEEYVKPEWEDHPITYLELGVFEGGSMTWMLDNVLTHPDSRAVGVDPWLITSKLDQEVMDTVKTRAFYNTAFHPNCILQRGNSCEILRRMNGRGGFLGITKKSVDICMIDGDHNAYAVLDDALQVLPLMKQGGVILFDDVENRVSKPNHVKQGIELLLGMDPAPPLDLVVKHRFMEIYRVTI